MNLFTICIIGYIQTLSLWRKDSLIVHFLDSASDLEEGKHYDFIFLSTPIDWHPDGNYDANVLQSDIDTIKQKGYFHQLVATTTLPIGLSAKLGCHYLPIQQLFFHSYTPIMFGCSEEVMIDAVVIKKMLTIISGSDNVCLRYTNEVEMIFLITSCQNYINQSFQKEMSHFCNKNKITSPFPRMSWNISQEMTPVLVYMIRQMEDAKLDCPILYSCLFRQHYIDIPI